MRNAMNLTNGFVLTTDNSGGIGEKKDDIIFAPNDVVSYFAARVALLEQWAANSEMETVIVQNFTGENAWEPYLEGVKRLLAEVEQDSVQIIGSSETNMVLLQSAMSVTIIGRSRKFVDCDVKWFIFGQPQVGNEVLEKVGSIADLKKLKDALGSGLVKKIWPVGSKGIQTEARAMFTNDNLRVISELDVHKSAGPSTVVFIGIPPESIEIASRHFSHNLKELIVN